MSKSRFNANYIQCLTGSDLARYKNLIQLCGGIDPCEVEMNECVCDEKLIPNVNLIHIMDYLVNTTNSTSMEKMRNYNSSDAYRFLVDGWVKTVMLKRTSNNLILCLGKVKHSFSIDAADNKPWALLKESGEILCGWCTCKAGCGESCNHLSAMLYALEYGASKKSTTTCTSRACSWLPPHLKDVPYSRIKDVNYETPARKRRKLMHELEDEEDNPSPNSRSATSRSTVECSPAEVSSFFEKLNVIYPSSALLRVIPGYCEDRVPPRIEFPTLEIFNKDHCDLTLHQLRDKSEEIFRREYKITVDQHIKVEERTRKQSSSKLWFLVRKGRVGGSTVHSVMTTDLDNPSLTSVHSVCDPLRPQKKTVWMVKGSSNEPKARKEYLEFMQRRHFNFSIKQCGAKIPVEYPFLIASTDGEVQCDCCGKGILEVKCPKDAKEDEDPVPSSHYDQIQHYLLCLGPEYKYADYLVWHKNGPTHKRIFPNRERQEEIVNKCELYCRQVAIPELLGRYFSSLKYILDKLPVADRTGPVSNLICYCQKPDGNPSVDCCGKSCTFTRFHLKCVSLKTKPKKWLCPECKPSSVRFQ